MATIAIGDIHGDYEALQEVLAQVEPQLSADDTVVFLGDYIDRGLRSRECIARILAFKASSAATVVGLLGNHEEWMLRTFSDQGSHSWLLGMDGAFDTIASYSPEAAETLRRAKTHNVAQLYSSERVELPYHVFFEAMPPSHLEFFQNLQTFHRTRDGVCTHGGCDPGDGPLETQWQRSLLWGTHDFQTAYQGPDTLVYGHWSNGALGGSGRIEPVVIGRTVGIDTLRAGVLTALRLPDGAVFQSGSTPRWTLTLPDVLRA